MTSKFASILDFPKPSLDPQLWNKQLQLRPEVRNFILEFLESFFAGVRLLHSKEWIKDIQFVGSNTTNTWNSHSDVDIHLSVDLDKFIKIERPDLSDKEASDYLDSIRKQVDQVKAIIPNSTHPIELYFNTKYTSPVNTEWSGIFSILTDEWLKYPHVVDQTFNIEKLYPDLLNIAKEVAVELDETFGDIKREIQDIKELDETIGDWPQGQRDLFEKKLQKKLDELQEEIEGVITIREDVTEKRKHYKALSQQEITMKYLSKYFYMHVLTDLKTLLKQSPDLSMKDIPVVENIMQQASLRKLSKFDEQYWIAPDGKVFDASAGHQQWIFANELVLEQYGIEDYKSIEYSDDLIRQGWIRAAKDRTSGIVLTVESLSSVPQSADKFLAGYFSGGYVMIEDRFENMAEITDPFPSIQKAVSKALQQKRISTASKHEDSAEGRICIDFDETIAEDNHNGTIGEPEPNAKAALEKLKADGWYIIIFSHRSTTEYGEDQIKEFLDKYDMPYDEIYTEKPNAEFFVDDRAITFTTWDEVLKKVETEHLPEKKASLNQKYWIDPNGKEYPVGSEDHLGWIEKNIPDLYDGPDSMEQADAMIKDGWTRITTGFESSDSSDFAIEVADLHHIPPYLDNFIAKHFDPNGNGFEIDDASGNYVKIIDPFPSLQKAVNKALRQPVAAALSKKESAFNPYNDSKMKEGSPYAIYIGTQKGVPELGMPDVKLYNIFGNHPRFGSTVSEPTLKELDIPIREQNKTAQSSDVTYGYNSTQFYLPKEIAQQILDWGLKNISEEELFDDKDKKHGRQLEPHVSIHYHISDEDAKNIENIVKDQSPVKIKFGKISIFKPEDKNYEVVVIEAESKEAEELHKKICNQITCEEDHKEEYHPHVTIATIKEGFGKKYEGQDILDNTEITVDNFVLSVNDVQRQIIELRASFMPSNTDLAPSDDWAGTVGYPTNESMDAPQNKSDESTWYSPENDRPRSKNFLKRMLSLFQKPLSKKEPKEIVPVKEAAGEDVSFYLNQIPSLSFKPVSDSVWQTIQAEGLDVEANVFDPSEWLMAELKILPEDIEGLKQMNDAIVEKFNTFDIVLKEKYHIKLTDLIDYENGRILIVKPAQEKTSKQWTTPTEYVNQPGMDWQWADEIYSYVGDIWQDLLSDWMNLDPKNYVKPVILIEKIYQDQGAVSARVHIEFVNTAGNTDAFMKLIISANIQGAESMEPEGREHSEHLTDWEIDVKDYGKSDELEKTTALFWSGPAYRVQTGYEHNPTATAADVVRYEQEELGNSLGITPEIIEQLSNVPATNIVWVTKSKRDANRYKSSTDDIVEQVNIPNNSSILAEDGDGGYLILLGGFEKSSSYGPTNYQGPSVADHGYQNSAWDGMNVTYSPEEDQELMDQNGDGGYPNRWMSRHRGPFYTNEGKVVKMLEETSALENSLPDQKFIPPDLNAATAIRMDNGSIYWSDEPQKLHVELIKELGLPVEDIDTGGRIVDGIYYDSGPLSDTSRYIRQELAKKRVEQKRLERGAKLSKKAAISGQVVNTILQLIQSNGSATYNITSNKNLVGTDAYAVAIYPDREQIVSGIDFDTLEGYLEQNEDLLNSANNSFGAWVSGDKTYLDVVATVKDKKEAMYLGYQHKQLAIFSLKDMKEIPLQRVAKLAGVYSDKEMQKEYDKVYSERWPDDSAPIDGGNEYYDWSELGSNDYPNPKDEEKEHVYMDMLDNPAEANFPAGLPEYWVTFYDSNPNQGDQGGI